MIWSCNMSMGLAAFGLFTGRPRVVSAAAVSVAIDQMLWYIDILGFSLVRRWPIGVAKYLTWPETTWARILSSTHHIWFLPFCLRFAGFPERSSTRIDVFAFRYLISPHLCDCIYDFYLAIIIMSVTAISSRWLTPCRIPEMSPRKEKVYLNINLVYEIWPDLPKNFPIQSSPIPAIHLQRLLIIWVGLSCPCAALLAFFSPWFIVTK